MATSETRAKALSKLHDSDIFFQREVPEKKIVILF